MENTKIAINAPGAFTLLAVACLTIMVGCVIVPGLPRVAVNLGVSGKDSWLVTLPSLGVVLFGALAGKFIQRQGPYRGLYLGLVLYGALGLGAIWLRGVVPVFLDRLLLGGATALVMVGGTSLISRFYQGAARLRMIAAQGMAIELGGVIFLFIGGLLAAQGWWLPFLLYLLAWLFLLMTWVFVPRVTARHEPESAFSHEPGQAVSAKSRIGMVFLAAAVSMVVFFSAVIALPERLHGLRLNEAQTGYFLSFVSLVAVAAAWLMPRLVRRVGSHVTLLIAFFAYALAHFLFAFGGDLPLLMLGAILMGSGFGFSIPLVNHLTVEESAIHERGRNLANLSVAIFLGQFLSSFMALIPGDRSLIFIAAAVLAILVGVVFGSRQAF